ncbi:MAG TPA: lysophospholipid acyltransferase family protein [Pyrinomonadaceae bacterium]|nr:lysophospholipid acyltransferase family protein [Pyrinomonadaceae bacterium]
MMTEDVRVLRLPEMISRQKGSPVRRVIHAIISIALRLFFRRIETSNSDRVPMTGPLIFVLNHPNGLIDPAMVFCALPRRVSFLAKSTLFRLPILGYLMRVLESLPVYRRIDKGEDVSQNLRTFEACHELLRRGRCIALFPEGISHSKTELQPVKTGAARIALGALSSKGAEDALDTLRIQPVGLYYTSPTTFRSEALLRFGDSFEVESVEPDETGQPPRAAVKELSKRIEDALREVTLNVESREALEEVTKAEQLFSSIYESLNVRQSLTVSFNRLRELAEWRRRTKGTTLAPRVEQLRTRILSYEEELSRIGITPENLSLAAHSGWYVFQHFLLRTILLALLFPLALVGAVLHFPAYMVCDVASRIYTRHGADDSASTVKILVAILFMPLTWMVAAGASYYLWGWRAALLAFPLSIIAGYVAMRSMEEMYDMRGWFKAIFILLRHRGLYLRLLIERKSLHAEMEQIAESEEVYTGVEAKEQ